MRCQSAAVLVPGLACLLTACATPPPPVPLAPGVVRVAPPAPRVEVIGVPPVGATVWLNGYWGWDGRHTVWVGGRWERPRPGTVWVSPAWVPVGGGYAFQPGHWAPTPR